MTIPEKEQREPENYIGVDVNTTGPIEVVSNPKTGKVWKFGKKAEHIHKKYKNTRMKLQVKGKYKKVKQIKNKENRIVRDLNHKISKKIVEVAAENNCGIKLENIKRIRKTSKQRKSSNTPCTAGRSTNCNLCWNTKLGCSELKSNM